MKSDQNVSRPLSVRSLLLALAAVIMAISYFAFSAPPRRTAPRRTSAARRPHAAHRPARHRPVTARKKALARKRIGTLRPVVVGGGGTVVVKDVASDTDDVDVVPVEAPAEETQPDSPGETLHTDKSSAASDVPSDADDSMADSPSYKVIGVEDNGLTIVVDVDGQETKVRLIGLAEPQDDAKDQGDRRPGKRRGAKGAGRKGPPRLPTEIFLKNMLQGEEVYIVYDSVVEEQDEDGKYVAYIYRAPDGMLLNTEVLRQGFGVVDPGYDFAEKDTFQYYQDKAKQAQKGLWNKSKRPKRNGPNGKNPRRDPDGKPEGRRK